MAESKQTFIRDANGADMLEMFLVFAIATILATRGFLALTGWPQLGGGGLHIAHMLWGGLGMLAALILLLSFWSPALRNAAAVIGGIGFGLFIDELGKFITSDNNYFFQPAIAVIYVVFILLFLVVNALHSRPLSEVERQANLDIAKSAAGVRTRTIAGRGYDALRERLERLYQWLVDQGWFRTAVAVGFIGAAVLQAITIITLFVRGKAAVEERLPVLEQVAWVAAFVCILIGVERLRKSRLSAYLWFRRSTLITICVTQVFMFYYSELAALGGLAWHLAVFFTLRFVIQSEQHSSQATDQSPGIAPASG